jgi:GR25 family glycosyltransferase involved in LPS biosynthesis
MNKIDKIYFINLDRRPDRKEHFLNECTNVDIPMEKVERYKALDGSTYQFSKEEADLFKNVYYKGKPYEKGVMGNQLSHYYILRDMIKNKYDYIMILQDDVIFKKNFIKYVDDLMENVPVNTEIINIGFHKHAMHSHFVPWPIEEDGTEDCDKLCKTKINDHLCILKNIINPCSLGYIVTFEGAINLLEFFNRHGFLKETDWNYNDYLSSKSIFYGSTTVLCTGNPNLGSDIFT